MNSKKKKLDYVHDNQRSRWFKCSVPSHLNISAFNEYNYAYCCQDKSLAEENKPSILILMPTAYLTPTIPPRKRAWVLWTYSEQSAKKLFTIDERLSEDGQKFIENVYEDLKAFKKKLNLNSLNLRPNVLVVPNLTDELKSVQEELLSHDA
tara:strand:- start:279 stop:731 length:453 start_codon:yes stop_codon:yes gene_type:complete